VSDLHDWSSFFSAEVGAAAALTGLVIVAVSINLKQILAVPILPVRAVETLFLLMGALIVASLGLTPGQPLWGFGVEAFAIGLLITLTAFRSTFYHRQTIEPEFRFERLYQRAMIVLVAAGPFIVGGIILMGGGTGGLYWVMAGVILALVVGVLNAWVLLVEIMR
jgi:hypothetical protein